MMSQKCNSRNKSTYFTQDTIVDRPTVTADFISNNLSKSNFIPFPSGEHSSGAIQKYVLPVLNVYSQQLQCKASVSINRERQETCLLGLGPCLYDKDVFSNKTSFHILWATKLSLQEKPNCTKTLTKLSTEN